MTEYLLFVGVRFLSPFSISARIVSILDLDEYAFISRSVKFSLRTDLYFTLDVEAVLAPIFPNTDPASCTDIIRFFIEASGGAFLFFCTCYSKSWPISKKI